MSLLCLDHVRPDCSGVLASLVAGHWQARSLVLVDGALYVYNNAERPAASMFIYLSMYILFHTFLFIIFQSIN